MKGILIDSCVILDVITEDPHWFEWSASSMEKYANDFPLYINPIIYAEVSIGYQKIEELEDALPSSLFKRLPIPWEAAFLAGKAYVQYRKLGGPRLLPLPDFYIGAHALVEQLTLLTRDNNRFNYYFPKLKQISPANSSQ